VGNVALTSLKCGYCAFTTDVAVQLFAACEKCGRAFSRDEESNRVCDDCYVLNPASVPRGALAGRLPKEHEDVLGRITGILFLAWAVPLWKSIVELQRESTPQHRTHRTGRATWAKNRRQLRIAAPRRGGRLW